MCIKQLKIEIIIINDGSTDDSEEKIKSFIFSIIKSRLYIM